MQTCPNCGEENPDRFRMCGMCGTSLAPEPVAQEVRRTVTIVFCDLKGSTSLGESIDTESLREVLNRYFQEMQAVLERHGGTVEKFIGDAVMAVFGLPRLHEDDALRAVRAAMEMKEVLADLNVELEARWGVRLENRTGVNTGEVVAGDVSSGQRLVTGDTVNTAARLEQAAPALEVLIGEPTYRLVKGFVEVEPVQALELKGKAERVPAYRLIEVRGGEAAVRNLEAPMVGRREELETLIEALESSRVSNQCQVVTLLGPAGVGKSRLLREFEAIAGETVRTLRGRCLSYGEGITYWPLAEIVRAAAGIANEDSLEVARTKLSAVLTPAHSDVAERIAGTIGLTNAIYSAQETFWAARRFLEIVAGGRRLIVVIDDIHWAEQTFLDLLGHIADTSQASIVLSCSARQDLLEDHPDWMKDHPRARFIRLLPLSTDESAMVIENILGTAQLDESVRGRIVKAADGNPLFVEQILSMLIDQGMLSADESGHWVPTGDLEDLDIPPTIQALLSARLERLTAHERAVVERGAVIGQVFYRGAVMALVTPQLRDMVSPGLASLTQRELIRPEEAASFAGEDAYRFLHILIRDAAYHGLLKRTRAELHEAFVDWLEGVASDRVTEFEEIRGYHLEQAYLILIQLGTVDDRLRQLGVRGAGYLSASGHRALTRGDMPAAANLLQRSAALLPEDHEGRPRVLLEAGEALSELGEFVLAEGLLAAATESAQALGNQSLAATASLSRMQLHYTTEGEAEDIVVRAVEDAIPVLEEAGGEGGLYRAWRLLTLVHWTANRYAEAERATRKMIEYAALGDDPLVATRHLASLAVSAAWGPTPVEEAITQCEELLVQAAADRKGQALIRCELAHLEAMRGEFDRARDLYRQSRATFEELGWKVEAALISLDSGPIEMLAGDPESAEKELRTDYETLNAMGERNYISTTAGFLAEALYRQDRYDEAEEFAATSREIAAVDDLVSQVLWRSVRAKVLARRGHAEDAERLAREAVDLMSKSDSLNVQGNTYMDLGAVLRMSGRDAEAADAYGTALRLYELKGNVTSAARARAFRDSCSAGTASSLAPTS